MKLLWFIILFCMGFGNIDASAQIPHTQTQCIIQQTLAKAQACMYNSLIGFYTDQAG